MMTLTGKVVRSWRYVGVQQSKGLMDPLRAKLSELIGAEEFERVESYKMKRDGENKWHSTFLMYKEYKALDMEQRKLYRIGEEIEYSITGIGKATGIGKVTGEPSVCYYATLNVPYLANVWESLGLETVQFRDYHITLGFAPEDVHEVDKSDRTRIWKC